jgi:hypothetical protein
MTKLVLSAFNLPDCLSKKRQDKDTIDTEWLAGILARLITNPQGENGGGEGGRGAGKEREEKKKKRKVEDSNLCYSTDAQQNHVLRGPVLSVSHKLSLIKLNADTGERQGEIIRT